MNWFVKLIQFIDNLTGIGENYSFLVAGASVIFILMVALAVISKFIKNI